MKFRIAVKKALEVAEKNLQEHITEREGVKTSNHELSALFYAKPIDNRVNYSRFIGALKLAAENGQENIDLDEIEYDQLFNDNWDWRMASKATNSTYTVGR